MRNLAAWPLLECDRGDPVCAVLCEAPGQTQWVSINHDPELQCSVSIDAPIAPAKKKKKGRFWRTGERHQSTTLMPSFKLKTCSCHGAHTAAYGHTDLLYVCSKAEIKLIKMWLYNTCAADLSTERDGPQTPKASWAILMPSTHFTSPKWWSSIAQAFWIGRCSRLKNANEFKVLIPCMPLILNPTSQFRWSIGDICTFGWIITLQISELFASVLISVPRCTSAVSPPLTCLGQQRRHGPRHEEDTADKAHLNEKHLPPFANFKYLRNYCLFGRAHGGVGVVPLHASQLARLPLFCVLESRKNCRPARLFTLDRAGLWSSFQAALMESSLSCVRRWEDAVQLLELVILGQWHGGQIPIQGSESIQRCAWIRILQEDAYRTGSHCNVHPVPWTKKIAVVMVSIRSFSVWHQMRPCPNIKRGPARAPPVSVKWNQSVFIKVNC